MDRQTAHRYRWGALVVLIICLLVLVADNTILDVALRVLTFGLLGLVVVLVRLSRTSGRHGGTGAREPGTRSQ